jgi:hypothetical protein
MLLGGRSCLFRKAVVFFNVTTKIRSRDAKCGDRKLSQIGKMVNTQLRELGIGEDDVVELADTVFHARVCKVPETNSPTQGGDRELWTPWSTWMGGGVSSNYDVNPCSTFVRSILTQSSATGLPRLWW